jgi:hypothetical protein
MKKAMDVFEATDQPEICRKCGARTEVAKIFPTYEICKCPACSYEYRLYVDMDEFDEDEIEIDNTPSKKSADFWK